MKRYICSDCEDYTDIDDPKTQDTEHCACGGHLHIQKVDHYELSHTHDRCNSCYNFETEVCNDCKWNWMVE